MDSDDPGGSRRYAALIALVIGSGVLTKVLYAEQPSLAAPHAVEWSHWTVWVRLVVSGICLLGIVFCSLSEIALVSVNRPRLRKLAEAGHARAAVVLRMFEDTSVDYLSTLILMINVFILLLSNMMTWIWIQTGHEPYLEVATAATILVILLFGEIMPKSVAAHRPEAAALRVGPVVAACARSPLVRWAVGLVGWLCKPMLRLFRADSRHGRRHVITTEELRVMTDVSEEEGVLEADEAQMIDGIISFGEQTVREIMTPRVDLVALTADQPLSEAIQLIVAEGRSRVPVYEGSLDNVIGILYANDILRAVAGGDKALQRPIRDLVRPCLKVPESKRVDELLLELQRAKVHMALVIDEHGGLDGVVTIEDILEEIVGEVVDEHDDEVADIQRVAANTWLLRARASRREVEEALQIQLPQGDFDTIGGFIIHSLQTLPDPGAKVTYGGIEFEVTGTRGPRITRICARRLGLNAAPEAPCDTSSSGA